MDDVACSGSKAHTHDCRHRGWGSYDCTHSREASVRCSYGSSVIRLVDGGLHLSRAEVWGKHMWCVANWAIQVLPLTLEHSVVVSVISGWMTSIGEEESRRYLTMDIVAGQVRTVTTGRMQEWSWVSRCLGTIPKRLIFDYYFCVFLGASNVSLKWCNCLLKSGLFLLI